MVALSNLALLLLATACAANTNTNTGTSLRTRQLLTGREGRRLNFGTFKTECDVRG